MKIYCCTRPTVGWVDIIGRRRNATLRTEYLALIDRNPSTCFSFRLDDYINKDNIRFWTSGNHSYRTASANRPCPSVVTVRCALRSVTFGSVFILCKSCLLLNLLCSGSSRWSVITETWVRSQTSLYVGRNGTGTLFSPITSIFLSL
jgi:hypothetical protein